MHVFAVRLAFEVAQHSLAHLHAIDDDGHMEARDAVAVQYQLSQIGCCLDLSSNIDYIELSFF